jgi:hypothetical protein
MPAAAATIATMIMISRKVSTAFIRIQSRRTRAPKLAFCFDGGSVIDHKIVFQVLVPPQNHVDRTVVDVSTLGVKGAISFFMAMVTSLSTLKARTTYDVSGEFRCPTARLQYICSGASRALYDRGRYGLRVGFSRGKLSSVNLLSNTSDILMRFRNQPSPR